MILKWKLVNKKNLKLNMLFGMVLIGILVNLLFPDKIYSRISIYISNALSKNMKILQFLINKFKFLYFLVILLKHFLKLKCNRKKLLLVHKLEYLALLFSLPNIFFKIFHYFMKEIGFFLSELD